MASRDLRFQAAGPRGAQVPIGGSGEMWAKKLGLVLLQTSMEKKSPPVESKGHANLPGCLLHHFFRHSAAMGLSPNPYSNTVSGGPHRASMSG